MKFSLLMYLREAFHVKRYHTVAYVALKEDVGHHTAGVIANLFFLYGGDPPSTVIRNALYHDMLELLTGDIPATAKWRDDKFAKSLTNLEQTLALSLGIELAPLNKEQECLIKFADMMDLCFKSIDEIMVGNSLFFPILVNGVVYCRNLIRGDLKGHIQANAMFEGLVNNPHVNIMEIIDESSPVKH